MDRLEDARPEVVAALKGKTIVCVKVVIRNDITGQGLRLLFADGTALDVAIKGRAAGSEWHDYLAVELVRSGFMEQNKTLFEG